MFVKSQYPGEAHHTTRYEVTLGVAKGLAAPNHPEAPYSRGFGESFSLRKSVELKWN
jgi:hypothetical protein